MFRPRERAFKKFKCPCPQCVSDASALGGNVLVTDATRTTKLVPEDDVDTKWQISALIAVKCRLQLIQYREITNFTITHIPAYICWSNFLHKFIHHNQNNQFSSRRALSYPRTVSWLAVCTWPSSSHHATVSRSHRVTGFVSASTVWRVAKWSPLKNELLKKRTGHFERSTMGKKEIQPVGKQKGNNKSAMGNKSQNWGRIKLSLFVLSTDGRGEGGV